MAGLFIGSLGAVMDVSITMASSILLYMSKILQSLSKHLNLRDMKSVKISWVRLQAFYSLPTFVAPYL